MHIKLSIQNESMRRYMWHDELWNNSYGKQKKTAFKNENEETVLTTYRIVTGCTFHLKSQTTS